MKNTATATIKITYSPITIRFNYFGFRISNLGFCHADILPFGALPYEENIAFQHLDHLHNLSGFKSCEVVSHGIQGLQSLYLDLYLSGAPSLGGIGR